MDGFIDWHPYWSKMLPALDSVLWSLKSTEMIKFPNLQIFWKKYFREREREWLGVYDMMVKNTWMDWLID